MTHSSMEANGRTVAIPACASQPGVFLPLEETIKSFKAVCEGQYDHLPEAAFYMVGGIEEAVAKGEKMAAEA